MKGSRLTLGATTMPKPTFVPLADDAALLEAEFLWLKSRARRLAAERDARFARDRECDEPPRPGRTTARDARLQAVSYREREDRTRHEIDARLHGRKKGQLLGLERIVQTHKLSIDERIILLTATAPTISQTYTEQILGPLLSVFGACSVSDCIQLLEPQTAGDWLRLRTLFVPSGKLVSAGLIEVGDRPPPKVAAPLLASEVRPTQATFATLTGTDLAAE